MAGTPPRPTTSTPPAHSTQPAIPPQAPFQVKPGYSTGTPLTSGQQSAYDLMNATLASWGLTTLGNTLRNLIVKGDTNPATLSLELSQTKEYKQRFAANADRVKAGLKELNPAEYLAMEDGYQQVLRAYGMPKGFYDSHSDFNNFIANDLSAHELEQRLQVAHDQYQAAPGYVKSLWSQYFGASPGDAIAAILDPKLGTQLVLDRGQQVALGGAAAQFGYGINQQRAQQFQQSGVSLDAARNAYQQISQSMAGDQSIAKRFGTTVDQTQEENATILGQAPDVQKLKTLHNDEESLFKGGSGIDQNTLGVSQNY